MSAGDSPVEPRSPIAVEAPVGGFDRAGMRELIKDAQLASGIHKIVRAPFGLKLT